MGTRVDIHAGLIDRCQKNDAVAQEQIYRLYSKPMFHVSLRIVGAREDAEDVLQESFIAAFKSLDKFKRTSSFGSWLKRIVINRSLNQIRGRMYMSSVDDMEIADDEVNQSGPDYEVIEVHQALKELSPGYRTVFSLYYFEDYSHQMISETMDISVGTSKSQLNRARGKLRELILENRHGKRQA